MPRYNERNGPSGALKAALNASSGPLRDAEVGPLACDCRRTLTVSKGYSTNLPSIPAVDPKAMSLNASTP